MNARILLGGVLGLLFTAGLPAVDFEILTDIVNDDLQRRLFRAEILDDVDGDGLPDVAVVTSGLVAVPPDGSVLIYNGFGVLINEIVLPFGGSNYVRLVPDRTGDGIGEILVGTGSFGSWAVTMYDPVTGEVVFTLTLPVDLGWNLDIYGDSDAGDAGDVNGDGVRDYFIKSFSSSSSITVTIQDGVDGSLLHAYGPDDSTFANSFVALEDVNDDGFADFAMGDFGVTVDGACTFGSVTAYSGADGEPLWETCGGGGYLESFGMFMDGIPDMNGDGVLDLAVGAPFYPALEDPFNPPVGKIYLLSGATGEVLDCHLGTEGINALFGFWVFHSVNPFGDGESYLLSLPPLQGPSGQREVHLYSRATRQLEAAIPLEGLGAASQIPLGMADFDGDGIEEVAVLYTISTPTPEFPSEVVIFDAVMPEFVRGDANGDGFLDIADPLAILGRIALGQSAVRCLAAAEVNGDGSVDIADPIYLLLFAFAGGPPPPAPFPDCGAGGADLFCLHSGCP